MPQERLRLASLTVLGGSLHGRRYEPQEVVGELLIGSDPDCHLVVDLPSVSPIHARVWTDLDASKVQDTHAPRGVYLNGQRVEGDAPLGPNDVLWLGPPGEAGSVCVQPRFEPWVERLPLPATWADADGHAADEPLVEAATAEVASPEVDEVAEVIPAEAEVVAGEVDPPAEVVPAEAAIEAEAEADEVVLVGPEPFTPATAPAAEDDWAIAEPAAEPPAVPAEEPAPESQDEFFVAGEPVTADSEPVFIVTEPDHEDALAAPAPTPPALELPPLVPTHAPKPGFAPPQLKPVPTFSVPLPPVPVIAPPPVAAPATPVPAAQPPAAAASAAPTPAASPRTASSAPAVTAPKAVATTRSASARPVAAARRPAVRPAVRRAGGGTPAWLWPALGGFVALVVVAFGSVFAWRALAGRVHVDSVTPSRVRVGQRVTLAGGGFASDPAANAVLIDGQAARVLTASAGRLEFEVPAEGEAASERAASLVVRVGGRESKPVPVTVLPGPRLHGISPAAAMPGEEVVLAGGGWGVGATVRFGTVPAQPLAIEPTRIRVAVPPIPAGPGTSAPVVVVLAGVESNPAPFVLGHLPVLTGVTPQSASPGDLVQLSGLGFGPTTDANDARVAGAPALVVSASADALKLVVPWVGPGDASRALELRVRDNANVGQATLQVAAPPDSVEARFVAEPFTGAAGRSHALVSTGVGPAFVLAASGGRSAAERAVEAQGRLNAAVALLRTTAGLAVEARDFGTRPMVGLAGRPEVLLEVTSEDAAAYNEDWTGLRGRGGPVTPGRLARWWEAVARDLVLLTVRGERPRFAAALAPEGRVLGQLFDAAQKTGRAGVPRQLVSDAKSPLREGLRLIALRVPATVTAPAGAARAWSRGSGRGSDTGAAAALARRQLPRPGDGGRPDPVPHSDLRPGRRRRRDVRGWHHLQRAARLRRGARPRPGALQRPDARRDALLRGPLGRREARRHAVEGRGRPRGRRELRAAPVGPRASPWQNSPLGGTP